MHFLIITCAKPVLNLFGVALFTLVADGGPEAPPPPPHLVFPDAEGPGPIAPPPRVNILGDQLPEPAIPPGEKFPVAEPIPGKEGFCFNPWTANPVDCRGVPPGTLVRDPKDPDPTHKFRLPNP